MWVEGGGGGEGVHSTAWCRPVVAELEQPHVQRLAGLEHLDWVIRGLVTIARTRLPRTAAGASGGDGDSVSA